MLMKESKYEIQIKEESIHIETSSVNNLGTTGLSVT